MPAKNLQNELIEAIKILYQQYTVSVVKFPLMGYFILTCMQFVFDLIVFFIGLAVMGNDYDGNSYVSVLFLTLSSVFMSLDLFYILWVCS